MNYKQWKTQNLLREWEALEECQSRGVSDELRINLIEKELDSRYDVVAYRAKGNVTDWSDHVVLPSYPVQWELTTE